MDSRWYIWSLIPGLHWFGWIQVGNLTRDSYYYWLGLLYALPLVFFPFERQLAPRYIIASWLLSMLHMQLRKRFISQRIAEAGAAPSLSDKKDNIKQELLHAALIHNGRISVTQGVMETGRSFEEVEHTLDEMVQSGYVFTRNHPDTGVIEYVFKELL
jgi:hypothetical protein